MNQLRLLQRRAFGALFWTPFLGAVNHNRHTGRRRLPRRAAPATIAIFLLLVTSLSGCCTAVAMTRIGTRVERVQNPQRSVPTDDQSMIARDGGDDGEVPVATSQIDERQYQTWWAIPARIAILPLTLAADVVTLPLQVVIIRGLARMG